MPFGESQSRVYVSVVEGMLAVRSSESDTKAVKRELKSGHIIYERRYKNVTGKIKEMYFRQNDVNGKKWEDLTVLIYDGTDYFQISMPFPGKYSLSVLRTIKNVDLSKEVTFNPWTKTVNDKVKAVMYLNQNGSKESVPWYFTPDTPNGMPDLVPYSVPGSSDVKYSDVARNTFLRKMVETEITPKLNELWRGDNTQSSAEPEPIAPAVTDESTDDLPF